METRLLGRTGLSAGCIGMGTWRTFDVSLSDPEAAGRTREITVEALENGVNLFDSSPMYGTAEEVLARALDSDRERALVATKVWTPNFAEGRRQIERALAWYGGVVDVYQVHNLVAWQEYLPLLHELKKEGKVRAVGITHYAAASFGEMQRIMETEEIDTIQIPYDATDTRCEALLALAAEQNIGVIVMSPLGTGRLVENSPSRDELRSLEAFGIETWAQALLKWVVSDQRVTSAIPATSRPGRMAENAAAGNPPFFGPEERERVSKLARRRNG